MADLNTLTLGTPSSPVSTIYRTFRLSALSDYGSVHVTNSLGEQYTFPGEAVLDEKFPLGERGEQKSLWEWLAFQDTLGHLTRSSLRRI